VVSEKEKELVSLLMQECESTGDIQVKLKRLTNSISFLFSPCFLSFILWQLLFLFWEIISIYTCLYSVSAN
jgi:hypothetical protein